MTTRTAGTLAIVLVLWTWPSHSAQPSSSSAALSAFLSALTPQDAAAAADRVLRSRVTFDQAYAALKAGRAYVADVQTGVVTVSHRIGSHEFPYSLDVPATYDPRRAYRVRVQLHGGVMRPQGSVRGTGGTSQLAVSDRDGEIYVIPTAWRDAPWWGDLQLENLRQILDTVKRRYNVDENRIVLSGVSDGGTAAYYVAMRDTTPFASYAPLIGHLIVLRSPDIQTSDLYPHNLLNKPLFVVNGGRDPLYPAASVTPFIEHFQRLGVNVQYLPQAEAGHNTAWWPEVREAFEAFVRQYPRHPHPRTLTWETDGSAGTTRSHWLVIDKVAARASAAELPDLNDVPDGEGMGIGIRNSGTRITSVLSGSNAERLGLRPGDVVVSVNKQIVPRGLDLAELLDTYTPGVTLTLTVMRNNRTMEFEGVYEPAKMPRITTIFPHTRPSGRADVVRDGNSVTVMTRGVAGLTLLVSPDAFDLAKPITVVANGRRVFNGRVTPSVATLMKWASRDNDRTMLYAAEVSVSLAP